MRNIPIPIAIISLLTGIGTWFLRAWILGYEGAMEVSMSTMLIVVGLIGIGQRKKEDKSKIEK